MLKHRVLRCALISLFWIAALSSAQVIGNNAGDFVFKYDLGGQIRNIPVYYFAPKTLVPGSRVVFVLHGSGRSGQGYRDEWQKHAIEHNFLVLCPEFSEADFPGWWKYNGGNLYDEERKQYTPRREWTFNVIEGLFDFVKQDRQMIIEAYCIFGHSAGAQFVHRMVLFMPEARFSLAIANGAGSYTYPLLDKGFVDGVQFAEGVTAESLKQSFQKEMIILVGARDVVSKTMPQDPKDFDQYDRLWMARHFSKVAAAEAEKLNVALNWHLRLVPDADHNSPRHAEFGSRLAAKSKKILVAAANTSARTTEAANESTAAGL